MPGCHGFVDLAVCDEAVLHPDRLQNVGSYIALEFLPADNFDQATKNLVIRVRIFPTLLGFVIWSELFQLADPARQLILLTDGVSSRSVSLQCGKAARMAEQLSDGDGAGWLS